MSPEAHSTDQARRAIQERKSRAAHSRFRITHVSESPPTWTVEGESGQVYRTLLPAYPQREGAQCSCRDFLTRGLGTCKHLEAVLAFVALNPPPPSLPPTGKEISWEELRAEHGHALRETQASGASDEKIARAIRRVGRRLTEP